MSKSVQLNIFDTFTNLTTLADNNVTRLFKLIAQNINLSDFISAKFNNAFYKHYGRKRSFSLLSFLNALLIKNLFKIPTIPALINFIKASPHCASFCNFTTVPDETKFSAFITSFSSYINDIFDNMVDFTSPICQKINSKLANTLIYDPTGVLANVKENNPKFFNSQVKNAKKFNKANFNNKNFNPYEYVYSNMPKSASASDCNVKLSFTNGDFCYAHKFGLISNGLGIPLSIKLLKEDCLYSSNPAADKDVSDFKSLKPVVSSFLKRHPDFVPYTFIGDSAFDKADTYDFLLKDCNFQRAVIPINPRNTKFDNSSDFDENGIPFCNVCKKPFKLEGKTNGKNRAQRIKFVCPLSFRDNRNKRYSACLNPCTTNDCRARYINASSNLRLYPGDVLRGSVHFNNIYKKRSVVERTINSIKSFSCSFSANSRNANTVFSNLLFGGITMLVILILADKLSLKSFKSFNQILNAA